MIAGITTLELLRKIILGYIPIDDERVNIYNQKFKIPEDEGLFVTIEHNHSQVFASRSNFSLPTTAYKETIDLSVLEDISIDIMSRNLEALQKKELFVMALNSYYSQQVQEANGFKVLRIAPINNLSALEGAAQLYRYEIPVKLFAWYQNITAADYFNAFSFQVTANGDPELQTEIITQPLTQPIF